MRNQKPFVKTMFVLFVLTSVSLVTAAIPDSVGWWTFNEGSGDFVYDWSGNGNHGTIYNAEPSPGVTHVEHVLLSADNYALKFTPSGNPDITNFSADGGYVIYGDIEQYDDLMEDWTFSAWVKLYYQSDKAGDTHYGNTVAIIGQDEQMFGIHGWWRFKSYGGSFANEREATYDVNSVFDHWYHVVAVFDGTTSSSTQGNHYLYIDGVQVDHNVIDADSNGIWFDNSRRKHFSTGLTRDWIQWGEQTHFLYGEVDEIKVWDVLLTPQQVTELFNAGPATTGIPPNFDCEAALTLNYGVQSDFNGDCYVDFLDFAMMSEKWLNCNDPADSSCTETW